MSRLDMNTCQTSIKTDILFSAAVTHIPGISDRHARSPSCLWSLRSFPSLPGSRLTNFYRDASLGFLQLVN